MLDSRTAAIACLVTAAAFAMALGACVTGPTAHWEKAGGDEPAFQTDNEKCGQVASRVSSSCAAGPSACGASIPPNRMDRPPHVDADPNWQRAYMECMAEQGWRVAQQ